MFLANHKYTQHAYSTKASAIIVNNSFNPEKIKATLIQVDDAYTSFSRLIEIYDKMSLINVEYQSIQM